MSNLTEGGEEDARAELAIVERLNEDIDQLAATARACDSLAPQIKPLLHLAWFFAEQAVRECTGRCSTGHDVNPYPTPGWTSVSYQSCPCCQHYNELRATAARIKGVL